ncbi:MAG: MBL fold metallo-hydrolase [Faecalicoccus sp.]|nr:MBL fold metallo-hydrolase [Faecalicoccus sp.]
MEIIKINDNSWRIEDGGVRFFVLEGKEKAAIIDTGMNLENVKEIVESITSLPYILINTHADRDHVHGNKEFDSFYMHPAEYVNYSDAVKYKDRLNPIWENDCIDLGERILKVIEIPGHTPGSIGLFEEKTGILISGDPIQEHGNIFMFGPYRNMVAYIASAKRLKQYDIKEIWPSHADFPISKESIDHILEDAEDILNKKIEGVSMEFHGREIHKYTGKYNSYLGD